MDLFWRIIGKIERFFYWGWKMRDNYDWDSCYLLDVLLFKLERIYRESINNTHYVWTQDRADKEEYRAMVALRICITLLKRLTKRGTLFYAPAAYDKHEAKWGDFVSGVTGVLSLRRENVTPENQEEEKADFRALMDFSHKIYSRDYDLLWKLLKEYSPQWWT
jgi:hypothetical protein